MRCDLPPTQNKLSLISRQNVWWARYRSRVLRASTWRSWYAPEKYTRATRRIRFSQLLFVLCNSSSSSSKLSWCQEFFFFSLFHLPTTTQEARWNRQEAAEVWNAIFDGSSSRADWVCAWRCRPVSNSVRRYVSAGVRVLVMVKVCQGLNVGIVWHPANDTVSKRHGLRQAFKPPALCFRSGSVWGNHGDWADGRWGLELKSLSAVIPALR